MDNNAVRSAVRNATLMEQNNAKLVNLDARPSKRRPPPTSSTEATIAAVNAGAGSPKPAKN
jgi:hypothetical protein